MTSPTLSVILIVPADVNHIHKTIRHLRAQTRVREIELVLVSTDPIDLSEMQAWDEFCAVKWVYSEINSTGQARAAGFKSATAPLIAYTEDHVFPSPNWADALIGAHQNEYAGVSVEMRNGNPGSVSCADMHLSFGSWLAPMQRRLMPVLPAHNTCYKRAVLARLGEQLTPMLGSEAVLHQELTSRKQKLFLESGAFIEHVNISRWQPFLAHKFWGGRIFGATRAQENKWSWKKRIVYSLGAPLIPLIRLKRILPNLLRTGDLGRFDPVFVLALAGGLVTHAFGEAVGNIWGHGDAETHYVVIEIQRKNQLRAGERQWAFE